MLYSAKLIKILNWQKRGKKYDILGFWSCLINVTFFYITWLIFTKIGGVGQKLTKYETREVLDTFIVKSGAITTSALKGVDSVEVTKVFVQNIWFT